MYVVKIIILQLVMFGISGDILNTSNWSTVGIIRDLDIFIPNENEYEDLNGEEHLNVTRRKRYGGDGFIESALDMREFITSAKDSLDNTKLPKFPGKDALRPFQNIIQVLSHSRSYRDGPLSSSYVLTTADSVAVSVDPLIHKDTFGYWTLFGGDVSQRCHPQAYFGNGWKAVFDCPTSGTYFAFFKSIKNETLALNSTIPDLFKETRDVDAMSHKEHFLSHKLSDLHYAAELLQSDTNESWYYSDPFKVKTEAYCYRWVYRLIKENEVGFVHMEPNPIASAGIYREYVLKVWIVDPSEATESELYSETYMRPSAYSRLITNKFHQAAVVPCIRYVHTAIEITSDAQFIPHGDLQVDQGMDSTKLQGPYWKFRIKVYMDRIMSTLSDTTFTITPRQHSALYGCFIGNVRVYIPVRHFGFLPESIVSASEINVEHSSFFTVERRFLTDNVEAYIGYEVKYVSSPWLQQSTDQKVQSFSNICINQELAISWDGLIVLTSDLFWRSDLLKVVVPDLNPRNLILNPLTLHLTEEEIQEMLDRLATSNNQHDTKINVFDLAYTSSDLVFLLEDSTLLFHSTDPSLRGIAHNTLTRRYKLGSLVKRNWCANTSTPKTHNSWIPSFSRDHGNVVIICHIPLEGARVIKFHIPPHDCEITRDSTKSGGISDIKDVIQEHANETDIHIDEEEDARIDASVEAKLRSVTVERRAAKRKQAKKIKPPMTRKDMENEKTFWLAGNTVVSKEDPHFSAGTTDGRNVRTATTGFEHYNDNVVFRLDWNFERIRTQFEENGLTFDIDEIVYAGSSFIERSAPNTKLFTLHGVEFTGVEKSYLLAVGFQSVEFPHTVETMNTTTVIVSTYLAHDLPVVLNWTSPADVALGHVDFGFSGTIIRRHQNSHSRLQDNFTLTQADFVDAQGRDIKPPPLSRYTSTVHSINTALPLYVLRLNDVIFFSSLDGSFAKPVLCYIDDPLPQQGVFAQPFLPFKKYDLLVTEKGVLSALSRQEFVSGTPVTPNEVFLGAVLPNEPLRWLHPFHINNRVFQMTTEEGEIIYGSLSYNANENVIEPPPKTHFMQIPTWSLLMGSYGRSAGENEIPLRRPGVSTYSGVPSPPPEAICPFASFDVYHKSLPFIEAQYSTRITAEVAFYGSSIPLEADILVNFSELQGVSVMVSSFIETEHDQTTIRKSIEIETFFTQDQLNVMYTRHLRMEAGNEFIAHMDEIRVFTLSVSPSFINVQCEKDDYFETIQLNIGCPPASTIRLIAEALPLRKIRVSPWKDESKNNEKDEWFYKEEHGVAHFILPQKAVHFNQHKSADCKSNPGFCKIQVPAGIGIETRVYGLSFRDVLVPKFEQFLTQHVRRVSGNVIIYDILDTFKQEEYQAKTNITQYEAGCLVDDKDWFPRMAERANYERKELSDHMDIYRYFRDCFSRKSGFKNQGALLPKLPLQELSERRFYLFNQSNRNSLRLPKKRNYIFVMRAVVVDTDYNAYTFCQKLDTFFVLQVVNIAQKKHVLSPYTIYSYVAIILGSIIFTLILYCYFNYCIPWTVPLDPNNGKTIGEEQEEDRIADELRKKYGDKPTPHETLSQRMKELEKVQQGADTFHKGRNAERSRRYGSEKRSTSEAIPIGGKNQDAPKLKPTSVEVESVGHKEELEVILSPPHQRNNSGLPLNSNST